MAMPVSEFSYGYAFTENLIRSTFSGPKSAPKFPSLIEEAKLGWDVNIDLPALTLFIQFKIGRLLKRSTAKEIANGTIPGLSVPYFRAPVTRRNWSDQHKHLVELEAKFPNSVFYAAPLAVSSAEFQSAYAKTAVHVESALFSPADIGLLTDDQQHNIIYKPGVANAWFCSEPRSLLPLSFSALNDRLSAGFSTPKAPLFRELIPTLTETILEVLPGRTRSEAVRLTNEYSEEFLVTGDGRDKLAIDLAVAREMSRVYLGAELIIAQPRI